ARVKLTAHRLPLSPLSMIPFSPSRPLPTPGILVNVGFEDVIVVFCPLPNNATGASPVDLAAALSAAITEQHLRAQTRNHSRWSRITQLRESAVSQPSFRLPFSR